MMEAPPTNALQKAQAKSFQSLHFGIRLIERLDTWRRAWPNTEASITMPCAPKTRGPKVSHDDAKYFLTLFLDGMLQIPHEVDLNALFFLTTLFNFVHHWQLWILPSIKRIHPEGHALIMVSSKKKKNSCNESKLSS